MTETLFDLTKDVAAELGRVVEGYATGGSATTIIDTVERTEADNHWNGGTAWILRDAAGAGAAPEGEIGYISDFDKASATATLRSALTEAVGAGDWYALADKLYPMNQLILQINRALSMMGVVPGIDTTLSTVAGQTLYSLPSTALNLDIRRVYVALSADASDPDYEKVPDWDVVRTAIGTADKLFVPDRYGSGMTILIDYMGVHDDMRVYSDKLNEKVHRDRVIYQACMNLLLWRNKQPGGSGDKDMNKQLNYYQGLINQGKAEYGIEPEGRASKLFPVAATRSGVRYPGDRNRR